MGLLSGLAASVLPSLISGLSGGGSADRHKARLLARTDQAAFDQYLREYGTPHPGAGVAGAAGGAGAIGPSAVPGPTTSPVLYQQDPSQGGLIRPLDPKLPGVQPSGHWKSRKLRMPAWRWPETYPAEAIMLIQAAYRIAMEPYVTEDKLKAFLKPLPVAMARQMGYDLQTGGELLRYLGGAVRITTERVPTTGFSAEVLGRREVTSATALARLQLVLSDIKPRRRSASAVPKSVIRYFKKMDAAIKNSKKLQRYARRIAPAGGAARGGPRVVRVAAGHRVTPKHAAQ